MFWEVNNFKIFLLAEQEERLWGVDEGGDLWRRGDLRGDEGRRGGCWQVERE